MDKSFKPFTIVVARSRKGGIGLNGGFPWPHIKKDLAHFGKVTRCTNLALTTSELAEKMSFYQTAHLFKQTTSASLINPVIMGRKTWDSIPLNMRPLPDRLNVILSRNKEYVPECRKDLLGTLPPIVCSDLHDAFNQISKMQNIGEIYIVGGQGIFEECLTTFSHLCKLVVETRINKDYEADVFMPPLPP
jgi:dihydrofolate reductase